MEIEEKSLKRITKYYSFEQCYFEEVWELDGKKRYLISVKYIPRERTELKAGDELDLSYTTKVE